MKALDNQYEMVIPATIEPDSYRVVKIHKFKASV